VGQVQGVSFVPESLAIGYLPCYLLKVSYKLAVTHSALHSRLKATDSALGVLASFLAGMDFNFLVCCGRKASLADGLESHALCPLLPVWTPCVS
jgi:hypothetical protein